MTITVTPEIEESLKEEARLRRTTPEQVALARLKVSSIPLNNEEELSPEEREKRRQQAIARVQSGYFARLLGPSSLMRDKAEERSREERHWNSTE